MSGTLSSRTKLWIFIILVLVITVAVFYWAGKDKQPKTTLLGAIGWGALLTVIIGLLYYFFSPSIPVTSIDQLFPQQYTTQQHYQPLQQVY